MKTCIVVAALILGLFRQADAGHVYTYGEFMLYPVDGWDEVDYMLGTDTFGGGHAAMVSFRQGTLTMVNHTIGMGAWWFMVEEGDPFTRQYTVDNPDKLLSDAGLHIGFDEWNDGDFFLGVEYEALLGDVSEGILLGYGWMHLRSEGGYLHKLGDSGGGQLSGIEIAVQAVPEPGTITLLGLAGLVLLIRWRLMSQ